MSLDIIKVGPNGQLEFDFDSLAARTSVFMAESIRMKVKGYSLHSAEMSEEQPGRVRVEFYTMFRTGNLAMFYTYLYDLETDLFTYACAYQRRDGTWIPVHDAESGPS